MQQRRAANAAAGGAASAPAAAASKKPRDTPFYQQRLASWQPILTPKWLSVTFALIGVLFVILGIVIWYDNQNIVELKRQYDGPAPDVVCPQAAAWPWPAGQQPSASCTITFNPSVTMKAPVYVYYELTNFYQNHRRYVRSKSDGQLEGRVFTSAADTALSDCAPLISNGSHVLHPCGLIANSFFNGPF
jgi:hypothetical protein